ncbi:MAG: hypothetical protein FWB73_01150 [Treponema sp.]|nr:hypothetical protein [Treponema sp.]
MKKLLISFLFCISSYFVIAQSIETNNYNACEILIVCALPQLLTGTNIAPLEIQNLIAQAKNDGIILADGKVTNRQELSTRVLKTLKRTEIVILFGSEPPERAAHVGYILELRDNNSKIHYILTGTNRLPLYNPCNVNGSILSSQAVYVYAP